MNASAKQAILAGMAGLLIGTAIGSCSGYYRGADSARGQRSLASHRIKPGDVYKLITSTQDELENLTTRESWHVYLDGSCYKIPRDKPFMQVGEGFILVDVHKER